MPLDRQRCRQSIMLVDSENEVVAKLASRLRTSGVRVIRVGTAAAAMREYMQRPADLLLVNVALPDQSGWLFVAKLRLTHSNASVFLCRAGAIRGDAKRAASIGAIGFLNLTEDDTRLALRLVRTSYNDRRDPSVAEVQLPISLGRSTGPCCRE
jgi:DNA-binding response OmpR family regulator